MTFSLVNVSLFSLVVNSDRTLLWVIPLTLIAASALTLLCLTLNGEHVRYDIALILTALISIPLFCLVSFRLSINFMFFKIVDGFSFTFFTFYGMNVFITFMRIRSPLAVFELMIEDIKKFKSTLFDTIDFLLLNAIWLITYPLRPLMLKISPLTIEEVNSITDTIVKYLSLLVKLYAYLFTFSAVWLIFTLYLTLVNPAIKYLLLKQGATLFLLTLYHPIYLLIKPLLALL